MFKNILLIILINICLSYQKTDQTLEYRATGNDVVDAVLKKLKDSGIFQDDNGIMKRIAYVESKFAKDPNTFRDDYYGGIWQIDQDSFTETIKQSDNIILSLIKDKFDIDFQSFDYKQLLKPLYSGLLARMRLAIAQEVIPDQYDVLAQAVYWKNYYHIREGVSVEEFVKNVEEMHNKFEKDCHGLMDLVIVLDGSQSIEADNYELAKEFVVNLIQTFSLESVNVGFVVFSTTSQVIFPMDSNLTSSQMKEIIMKSPYPNGWTYTNLGIISGVNILQKAIKRPGVPKIMAVFTDGNPNCRDDLLDQALILTRTNGIKMFAIGIGSEISQANLVKMAGSSKRVFSMSSYYSLSKSFQQINGETCKIPQTPELDTHITDVLGQSEIRYFQYELPFDGITVIIIDHGGNTIGYYSYDNENPSSALNEGSFKEQVFITYRQSNNDQGKSVTFNSSVFIAVQGINITNNYTVHSVQGNQLIINCQFYNHLIMLILILILLILFHQV